MTIHETLELDTSEALAALAEVQQRLSEVAMTMQLGPGPEAQQSGQAFRALIAIVNEATSDGRYFDALTWREPPLTVYSQMENLPGHEGAPIVGRIDRIVQDGSEVWGYGSLDTVGEAGRETIRMIREQFLRGVSVDAAVLDFTEDDDGLLHFTVEVGALTIVGFPAFRETQIELDDGPAESPEMGGAVAATVDVGLGISLVASARPKGPPRAWFDQPTMDHRRGLHVEEDGRVWGHIYGWGECHAGSPPGQCIQVPRGGSYRYIVDVDGRGVLCDDGTFVTTGPIFMSTDHADLRLPWVKAKDHYAHTGLAIADVTCGEDQHGIWVAGAIRPGAPEEAIYALRASAPSGDWRACAEFHEVGGKLTLVAILTVNFPGFPALAASFSGGRLTALRLASPINDEDCGCGSDALRGKLVARLEADLGLDAASRLARADQVLV